MHSFSPVFFKKLFETLDNNSVLMRVEDDGRYYPIWCSDEFCEMMEGTQEDFIKAESGGTMNTIHPDDREKVSYLFKNHAAPDGTNRLTIRKTTMKNHELYVCIHYAFIKENNIQYAYCSYFDVSDLKESQIKTQVMYEELNKELEALADESLAALRSNLTKGVVEKVQGTDLYDCDRVGAKIEDLFKTRMENMPIVSDREHYLKTFDLELLRQKYYRGEGASSLVIFSRRQSGRQCFIKYSASMRKDPGTGDVIVLGIETEYNNQRVTEILNNKVLAKQYDMVCYIVDGNYGVVIGDEANIPKGSIFPKERYGTYSTYIENQVYPVIYGTQEEKNAVHNALKAESIKKELENSESYTVDVPCEIEGEIFNKRFMFYVVDRVANFYILLKSDITEVIREQQRQNKLLSDALAEARYASEAKSSFLSNMSHDIRTPMNAIIGFTTLALQSLDSKEKISEYLGKIQVSSNHLLSLINDVLEMSRIESGKIELDEQPCNLPEILHDLNTIIVAQVESKQQELHMDALNVTDENILCDRLRLNQILLNLLSNAVKYTPNGGKISVRIAQIESVQENQTAMYEIRVKDNGIGMTQEFAQHVFEAFERERSSTVSGIQGTGLGMAITKKIVDLMGGTISVKTEQNVGTEFIIQVRFKVNAKKQKLHKIVELHDIHALVVDDDFDTCDSTTKMLAHMGMRPEWTLSGKEAVLRARQAKEMGDGYGVFIIDWRLNDLNGIEVSRRIREALGEETPIIMMTAYDWPAIKDEAESAGVNEFCSKPLFMSELHHSLERAIGNAENENADEESENVEKIDFSGKRLLIVDDVDVNREIAQMMLEMHGFNVELAVDGEDALEKVKKSKEGYYDAILMDIQMPKMDGYEATKAIHALPEKYIQEIPIIAMTANAFEEDKKAALDAGMNAHIAKPIDEKKVLKILASLWK